MKKYKYTEEEKQLNKVLVKQRNDLNSMDEALQDTRHTTESNILESKKLLESLGYDLPERNTIVVSQQNKTTIKPEIRSWEEIVSEANASITYDVKLTDLFTQEEIESGETYIKTLRNEFDAIHKLDAVEVIIPVIAGILSGILDVVLLKWTPNIGTSFKHGKLTEYVDKLFNKVLPDDKIKEFERISKVTFDAQDNRHTRIYVDKLSSHYHRFLSLGHDPILGFIFGVFDMLKGSMTTIDFNGKFVSQAMPNYSDRKATNLFEAIAKVFLHLVSDVNTPQYLPVPLMALFNKMQFGSLKTALNKDTEQTVAEIVKGMYRRGYDFKHFGSMSIPVMITEVIVRISYCIKRIKEGHSLKDAIPIGLDRIKHPKLGTMLWLAHTVPTIINAGKVALTENPLDINYPQWITFAKYSIKQLKWVLIEKPELQDKYVQGFLDAEWEKINSMLEETWQMVMK